MVHAMFCRFTNAEHHRGRGSHTELMSGAMHQQPIFGQAFKTSNLVANFVVENFCAAARDGIESRIAQSGNGVAHVEGAVFGDGENFRRGIAMQMNPWKALLDAAEQLLVPFDFEIGMESTLHQHARAAEFYRLLNLVVDGFEIENVAFLGAWSFQRTIESAEGAVLCAEIGVINVAVDDVSHRALGMDSAANRVRLHADADEVIGLKHLQSLRFGQGHPVSPLVIAILAGRST